MKFLTTRFWLVAAAIAISALAMAAVFLLQKTETTRASFVVATGSESGMYNRFGRALEQIGVEGVSLRQTAGSSENLELLQTGEVEFALVQNDLAQYAALGIRERERFDELNYVIPVFPEFVQVIVPEESELSVFSDLRGQQICIGNTGSGTYYNSIDVLEEADLREGIDYFGIAEPSFECLERLGDGDVAAVFLTSNRRVAQEEDRYRQLYLSTPLTRALSSRFQYFRVITPEDNPDLQRPQLAVDAYLATRSDVDQATVAQFTRRIIDDWPALQSALPGLPEIYVPSVRETIPYHPGSNGELEEAGLKQFDWIAPIAFVLWGLLVLVCMAVESWKFAYNRLGENPHRFGWRRHLIRVLGWCSVHIIAFSILALVIIVSMLGLRWIEDRHAMIQGTVSPFAQLDLYDSFVWLFTYVGNGFTADNIYPVSFAGKVVTGVLAVLGFATPIGALFYFINVSARKAERAQEGLGYPNFKDHVVICGWNEKARGIVTTLTGINVPTKKKVVLIARPEERFPLEKFGFNHHLVSFCRGSPTDQAVLKRAKVEDAAAVIVLADFAGNQSRNKCSILAAMNVRKANARAHLCTELEYIDNTDLLAAAGCETLIHVQLVACRMAAMAALSTDLIDFVLDCVTYHDSAHDELYSVRASKVIDRLGLVDPKVADLRLLLARQGVNVVGVIDDSYRDAGVDSGFTGGEDGTLVDYSYRMRPLQADATIVFAAQSPDSVLSGRPGNPNQPVAASQFQIDYPARLSILVCADPGTLATIEAELRSRFGDGLEFVGVDISDERPRSVDGVANLVPDGLDRCIILNTMEERNDLESLEQVNEADSDVMLLASLFRQVREVRGENWKIIGEIANRENSDLLIEAGADNALPVSMMVERFLAKEVYDQNHVTDFLIAGMRLSDGVHLHRHTVSEGDGFCGERYDRILATQIDGLRVMGWRPLAASEDLRNVEGDFEFHYRMVFDRRIKHAVA
ncbi:MAG: TAXI family TRAP transporter solute-binding subunit, partial [Pseudomonadota bacterium]